MTISMTGVTLYQAMDQGQGYLQLSHLLLSETVSVLKAVVLHIQQEQLLLRLLPLVIQLP